MQSDTRPWLVKIGINAIAGILVGALLSPLVNWVATHAFGAQTPIFPTDAFASILISAVVFLACLVLELVIDMRVNQAQFHGTVEETMQRAVRAEVATSIQSSSTTALSRSLLENPQSAASVGGVLVSLLQAIERITPAKRILASRLCETRIPEFLADIENSLLEGYAYPVDSGRHYR